jgi:DUF2997 family protein
MQIIELIVSPSGQTRIETKGFSGSSCQEATRELEKALGLRESEQLTAEFYAQQSQPLKLQEGQ